MRKGEKNSIEEIPITLKSQFILIFGVQRVLQARRANAWGLFHLG